MTTATTTLVWSSITFLALMCSGSRLIGQSPIVLSSQETSQHVGETGTVCGVVKTWSCDSTDGTTHLFFDGTTAEAPFRVVIRAADQAKFDPPFESRYIGRKVCVTGRIQQGAGQQPSMAVAEPAAIKVDPDSSRLPTEKIYSSCDEGLQFPQLLRREKPVYPSDARRRKIQGSVLLQGVVDINGQLRDVEVVSSLDPALDEEALRALRRWRFRPGVLNGKPVAVLVTLEMAFTLKDN